MRQAAVQDADEPVGQRSQALMTGGAAGAVGIAVDAGPGEHVNAADA